MLRTIQFGERREAPRKDAAIREHETPGAGAPGEPNRSDRSLEG
jgi:hypothetical protein